jgi:hypothetical protein
VITSSTTCDHEHTELILRSCYKESRWEMSCTVSESRPALLQSPAKAVGKLKPTLWLNYAHPSDQYRQVNRKRVSSFISSTRPRSRKPVAPSEPLPNGFLCRRQTSDVEKNGVVETGRELTRVLSTLSHRSLRNVSGGLRTDPFDTLPVKRNYAVSLALDYCESSV